MMRVGIESMDRRGALRALVTAGAVAALPTGLARAQQAGAAKLKGRIKQSVTRGTFRKMPTDEFCKTVKGLGLVGVDLVQPADWAELKRHGLVATMVPGVGSIKKGLNDRSLHPALKEEFERNVKAAAEAGWPNVIAMAGDREGISDEAGMDACHDFLKETIKRAEDLGVNVCMELLNSKVNHPGYMCDKSAWGFELCKRVGSPRFKMLYDIYHMQIMEGDIIRTITDNIACIAHFHTAGNPGRKDLDDEQELNYPPIMRVIAKLSEEGKYNGYVAHEFSPKNGVESLRQAVMLCDV